MYGGGATTDVKPVYPRLSPGDIIIDYINNSLQKNYVQNIYSNYEQA